MTDIPQSELDALRKAALAATPGEWTAKRALKPVDGEYDYAISSAETSVLAEAFALDTKGREIPAEANASYIAAFNPATGLRLLDRIAELEALMPEAAKAPEFTYGHCPEHAKPGGCQLHNLQCVYPYCDRRPSALQSPQAQPGGGV